jgi:hypothetical protein
MTTAHLAVQIEGEGENCDGIAEDEQLSVVQDCDENFQSSIQR